MEKQYNTMKEFWPFYLGEHRNKVNRILHFIGSTGVIAFAVCAAYFMDWRYLVAMPLFGYGFAWVGHFFFEKNRPATFKYPFKSLGSDFVMYFYTWTGLIRRELDKIS